MSVSLNQRILDRSIEHATFLRRLQSGEANAVVKLLLEKVHRPLMERLASRLERIKTRGFDTGPKTTKRIEALLRRNAEIIRLGMGEVYPDLRERLTQVGFMEASFQAKMVKSAFPKAIAVDFTRPSGNLLRSIVTARPFNGRILREWWQGIDVQIRKGVNGAIQTGLAQGQTIPEMTRAVRQVLNTGTRSAEAVVRTAVNHTATHAREQTYVENTDIIGKVRYVATLDGRTTITCASLDGKEFLVGDGPRPPMHFGCRSTTVPVLKPISQLGIPGLKDLPPGKRAALGGPVSSKESYGVWLKRQTPERQNRVLGAKRAQLFRDGKVPIDRFVDSQYRPLTLEQIMKREGLTKADLN